MAAGDFSIDALAFQAMAALDAYELGLEKLMQNWPNPELYARVGHDLDSAKVYCAGISGMTAAWVTVLISHTELMQGLWRQHGGGGKGPSGCADLYAEHLQTVRYLRSRCARHVGRTSFAA